MVSSSRKNLNLKFDISLGQIYCLFFDKFMFLSNNGFLIQLL